MGLLPTILIAALTVGALVFLAIGFRSRSTAIPQDTETPRDWALQGEIEERGAEQRPQ